MDLGLKGKTVLVTGASKGIGLACARGFALEGALPTLVSRSAEALSKAAAGIEKETGVKVKTIAADLSRSDAQKKVAEESKEALAKSGKLMGPIQTQILPAATFYPAEDYHQRYLEKRGLASCHVSLAS